MRIALLSYEYPQETGFGGIGTYTWTQARALARRGHTVHVVAGSRGERALRREDADGVRLWRRGPEPWAARAGRWLGRWGLHWSRNRLETASAMRAALRELPEVAGCDVVEMPECGAEGLLLDRPARARRLVRLHSPAALIQRFYDVPALDRRLCARLEAPALRRCGAVSACSAFLAREASATLRLGAVPEVLLNGIDLEAADRADDWNLRAELSLTASDRIVLFAGRIERRKGAGLLAPIARRLLALSGVAFVVIGDDLFGVLERGIRPELGALGGRLHALGGQPRERVRAALRQADAVLVPSLWESCPYAVLEAMAARAPLAAAAVGGVPELVTDGREALLAPTGDVEAIAAAATRLLDDPGLARRLGAAARRRAESELAADRVAARSEALYRRVAEGAA